ncbi:hypothetical protein MAJ_06403, partial [Metarhizium majus ARSEF 297]
MNSVTVYPESDSSPTIGFVPPGTAVLSAVHVLHQASDLSVLPAPVSAIPSTGELSTGSIAGIVIGAVVAALLLVGAAWYVWHWKRRSTAQKTQKDGSGGLGELHGEDSHRQELPTEERVGEVAGSNVAIELPNAHTAKPRPPVSSISLCRIEMRCARDCRSSGKGALPVRPNLSKKTPDVLTAA